MAEKPIYEPEPLPDTPGPKTGLPHSSYEQMRIRSNEIEKSIAVPAEVMSYKPKTPRSQTTEAQAQEAGASLVPVIEGHVRRQILNAKEPGLGAMQGPLQEPVQKAVQKAARPIVRQVVGYTKEKIRRGDQPTPAAAEAGSPKKEAEYVPPVSKTTLKTKAVSGVGLVSEVVPNPEYKTPEEPRSTRVIQREAELKVARNAITSKFHELASSAPDAHPDDVRLSTEGWARRNISRTAVRDHDDHLTQLTRGLEEQSARHPAMKERAALADRVGISRGERESSEDIIEDTPTAAPRKTTDKDVMAVARDLARAHYKQNFAGKVKNELTGETHPDVDNSPAHKSPMDYMKRRMGITDPAYHIESNYADEILAKGRQRAGGSSLPDLASGSGRPAAPPQAPRPGFAAEFARNPIGAVLNADDSTEMRPVISQKRANELKMANLEADQESKRAVRRASRAAKNNAAFNGGQNK